MDGFNKHLNIADEIDIMIFTNDGQSFTLTSFVYDIASETQMILSNPIKDGVLFPLEKSYTYYFRFYVENSGMYLFKGILLQRMKFDNLPSIVIQLESDIKRVQRRKFYRVNFLSFGHFLFEKRMSETQIEATRERMLKKYKNESEFIIEETISEKIAFDTIDLSGGGLRVQTQNEFQSGTFVKGDFKISQSWVTFKGEVVRCEKKDNNRFEVGIKFLELDSITQSKIVAYVFEVERNLIKKGLM